MTPQEAIKVIKHGCIYRDKRGAQALTVAVEALEKQILKKPLKKNPICYAKTKDGQESYVYDYHCPVCGTKLKVKEHHCPCGQALDWEEYQ